MLYRSLFVFFRRRAKGKWVTCAPLKIIPMACWKITLVQKERHFQMVGMLVFPGVTSKLTKGGDSLGSVLANFTKSWGVNCFCYCEMITVPLMVYIGMLFFVLIWFFSWEVSFTRWPLNHEYGKKGAMFALCFWKRVWKPADGLLDIVKKGAMISLEKWSSSIPCGKFIFRNKSI